MRLAVFMCAMLLLVCARQGSADELSVSLDRSGPSACQRATAGVEEVTPSESEPSGLGAGIVLDEHLLTDGSRDQDYNGGGELTFSGEHTGPIARVLDRALGFIDEKTCPTSRFAAPGWQLGHAFALLIESVENRATRVAYPTSQPRSSAAERARRSFDANLGRHRASDAF